MKRTSYIALFAFAVLIGATALPQASAGNYTNSAALYFDVELSVGDYLSSTDSHKIILVDDVTYSVRFVPCNATSACDFFTTGDMPDEFGLPCNMLFGVAPTGPSGGFEQTCLEGYQEMVESKSDIYELNLVDSDGSSQNDVFDRFTIASYGQLAMRSFKSRYAFRGWDIAIGLGGGGYGGAGLAWPMSMPMTYDATPTSQSRHYQSPHIVQHGRVYLRVGTGGTNTAFANVKGRTVLTTDPSRPVIDTTITTTSGS